MTTNDYYKKKVLKHYQIQNEVLHKLMTIAQQICPDGEWVFQMFALFDGTKNTWMACFTNGDDNVTAVAKNPSAAVALLIHYAMDGSVFPLTGNGGRKTFPADNGWAKIDERKLAAGQSETEVR